MRVGGIVEVNSRLGGRIVSIQASQLALISHARDSPADDFHKELPRGHARGGTGKVPAISSLSFPLWGCLGRTEEGVEDCLGLLVLRLDDA
jgi:hypothetical protein